MRKNWFIKFGFVSSLIIILSACGGGGGGSTSSETKENYTFEESTISTNKIISDNTIESTNITLKLPSSLETIANDLEVKTFSNDADTFSTNGGTIVAENDENKTSLLGYKIEGDNTNVELSIESTATALIMMVSGSGLDSDEKKQLKSDIMSHKDFNTLVQKIHIEYEKDPYMLESIGSFQDIVDLVKQISKDVQKDTSQNTSNRALRATFIDNYVNDRWGEEWTWYPYDSRGSFTTYDPPFMAKADSGDRVAMGNPTMVNYIAKTYDENGNQLDWFMVPRNSTLVQKLYANGWAAKREFDITDEISKNATHIIFERTTGANILNTLHFISATVGLLGDAGYLKRIIKTFQSHEALYDITTCGIGLFNTIDFTNPSASGFVKSIFTSQGYSTLETTFTSCFIPVATNILSESTDDMIVEVFKSTSKVTAKASNPIGWVMMIFDINNDLAPLVISWSDSPKKIGYDLSWTSSNALLDVMYNDDFTINITYSWNSEEWGTCSGECGTNNGTQTRSVTCKDSDGKNVDESFCTETKPDVSQPCTISKCEEDDSSNNITPQSQDIFQSGDTWKGLVYETVTSPHTGRVWLDRNLGASQVCTASDDEDCYGDYYQWGRDADGHEKSDSDTTSTQATDITAIGHGDFILSSSSPFDWMNFDSNGSVRIANWSKIDGSSICPVGYRVPTKDELGAETYLSGFNDPDKVFNSFLKLPASGGRSNTSGSMYNQDSVSYIWTSSSRSGGYAEFVYFDNSDVIRIDFMRASGKSVRCIKELSTTKSTVTITDTQSGIATTTDPITFTFTWSEDVSGFATDDIEVSGGTKGTFTQTSNRVYTLTIFPNSNSTSNITIDISANSAIDNDSNGNDAITQYTQAVNTTSGGGGGTITHNGVTYGTVTSPHTEKVWLDRNLGATQVCTSFDDTACYGDYYQWGRNTDGHEKLNSGTTSTQATNVTTVGHKDFIKSSHIYNYDWAKDADSNGSIRSANLSKTDGTSVCPIGFRVPTTAELKAETTDLIGFDNRDDAFESFLKLPSSGYLSSTSGSLYHQGSLGNVCSSSGASGVSFNSSSAYWFDGIRAAGRPVRCVRD